MSPALPSLVTHSGKFHCDDVFSYAVLRLALGLQAPGQDHTLLRTRKSEPIAAATIVWDVGSTFDAGANRFDHHQRGAPIRPDGTPYSSAGLIWQVYGERAVGAVLRSDGGLTGRDRRRRGRAVVRRIDELDNGVSAQGPVRDDTLGFASLVGAFNPPWDSRDADGPKAGDQAFLAAADFAEGVLRRRVDGVRARLAAEAAVLAAHRAGADPRILVLDRGMPWKDAVFTARAAGAVHRQPGVERQLDAGHHAAGARFVCAAPPVAGQPGRGCRTRNWRPKPGSRTQCSCMSAGLSPPRAAGRGRLRWPARRWRTGRASGDGLTPGRAATSPRRMTSRAK